MPAKFSVDEFNNIQEKLFVEGIQLIQTYGVQRTTVSKLTKQCGIAKGSFYLFYESKEEYLFALAQYCDEKIHSMWIEKLHGRKKMSVQEFVEFLHQYLTSDYDLMSYLNIQDYLWLKEHMKKYDLFNLSSQQEFLKDWLGCVSDIREDIDDSVVINLIKTIYAMREHKESFLQSSISKTMDLILDTIERYLTKEDREV